ncbi:peptidyl-prolyl cis-trans isomerase D [Paracoccus isoporae]|uniref:Peptidyl-prolyl cis-trans isomerase D n=1 Tax=Paracoccus isoporae TaxID=591205 RepID=A0A1G6XRE0_9RHOB|nr:peptidylprolyl isomerase [Paracoccus isoporae]SDD80779.1 peptidyl-prolyl cis-trans isomerase D [Paracoccus isoporae]
MSSLRTKGKSTIVWILMGMLLLGLGGFGVTSFSGGSTEIGSVGETEIDAQSYARVLNNQIDAIARQTGQRMSIEDARSMGLTQAVQAQLLNSAALAEEARKSGVSVGDRVVAEAITAAPAFQGPGGFDRAAYGELLRRQGLNEEEFESDMRRDMASQILEQAVVAGVTPPPAQVAQTARWMLERRDISWTELTAEDLPAPVSPADEETLKAWHQANADSFTAPEIRRITYAWLTPEMLAETVELDETALREVYDSRDADYNQPARRLVGRLVFESMEAAEAAKARIDAGEADFEQVAGERGLSLADTELGELTESELGAGGELVFAAEDNGVVGPVETDLGPALFAVNAILDPVNISFEEALPDLRAEAAADRARRLIADQSAGIEDLLAGGATLEDVTAETDMQIGELDWTAQNEPVPGEIGGYTAFRQRAAAVTAEDYPELFELDDGGVFALRLDEVVPPTLIPFEEVRDRVAEDWAQAEARRQLLAIAEEMKLRAVSETMPAPRSLADAVPADQQPDDIAPQAGGTAAAPGETSATSRRAAASDALPAPEWTSETGLLRDGYLETAPENLVAEAFKLEEGETEVLEAGDRVALIRVDRVAPADLEGELAQDVSDSVTGRIGASLQNDLFDYFARAVLSANGLSLDQSAIAAVESQL